MGNIEFDFREVHVLGKDHESYRHLHNQLFTGAAISSEWINWYHGDIGRLKTWSRGTRTWGAFDKESLIGIWSVEPKELKIGEKRIQVGRCFAVGIHADFRRHGLFVALSEFAIAQEKKIGEFEYILGFPQAGRSVIGGHFKAGWEEVQSIEIYSKRNTDRNLGLSRDAANVINDFKQLSFESDTNGIVENAIYKNFRWIQHPDHHYIIYANASASIVLKTYSNFCHILEIAGSVEGVKELLSIVQSLAVRHGWIEVNVWCADNERYKEVVESMGYVRGAEFGLPITMIAVKINALAPLLLEECTLQMGVEEGY